MAQAAMKTGGPRIFLLSPANCAGERARLVLRPEATFSLARRLHSSRGAPLGDVMAFVSGLYFRGKLAYARAFARPDHSTSGGVRRRSDRTRRVPTGGVLIITPNAGLRAPDTPITLAGLRAAAAVDIHPRNPRYRAPLEASARALSTRLGRDGEVVLLGSVASDKYVAILAAIFGERLRFPAEFVGRGDMSRGGLLLRCVAAGRELTYVPVVGAVRHGPRPPRLAPLVPAERR